MSVPPHAGGMEIAPGYEVIRHMRRGRSLDVYDVWSHELGARCIVKAVRPERQDDPRTRRNLLAEGRRLERIRHPHIVRGYETHEHPRPLVVMETLSGATLGYLIEHAEEPLGLTDVAHLGLQLGSAVRYLHSLDILHLDLKPANIVAEGQRAKVIDLSVARPPGVISGGVGTWCYLAPEQAVDGFVGPAADVWGIGAVLFEAVTGVPAFDDPEPAEGEFDDRSGGSLEQPSDGEELDGSRSARDEHGSWSDWEGSDSTPSWMETGDGPYPQLTERAARVDELRKVPRALADALAACLEPEPHSRPSVEELLAELEPFSGLPREERRWGRRSGRRPSRQRPTRPRSV